MVKEVLIFDLDGTLYHTMDFIEEYVSFLTDDPILQKKMFDEFQEITETLYQDDSDLKGIGDLWEIIFHLSDKHNIDKDIQKNAFQKIRSHILETQMIFHEDELHSTIRELNIPTAVMTNTEPKSAEEFLEHLNIKNIFDHHIYDAKKPHCVETHIEDLKAHYPNANFTLVGDNLYNDVRSMEELGYSGIFINHYNQEPLSNQTVFSLEELSHYLKTNFKEYLYEKN